MKLRAAALFALALAVAGAARAQPPVQATVLNPDLAGVRPLPGGQLLAWGSDGTVWWHGREAAAWRAAATPHSARIRALAASEGRLVAVGDHGLLLHSDSDGQQWQASPVSAQSQASLGAVDCRAQLCIAVGADGLVLRSQDGGVHWEAQPGTMGSLGTVRAGTAAQWWAGSADGRLWFTADDGALWRALRTPRGAAVEALAAERDAALVATADGSLLAASAGTATLRRVHRSTRGSFTRLQALPSPGAWAATGALGACAWRAAAAAPWRACHVGPRRLLRALASEPGGRTWMVAGEAGLLLRSTDQGQHWQPVPVSGLDEVRDLEDVAWDSAGESFVAVGAGGLVLRSDATGRHWKVEHSAPRHYVHALVQTREGGLLASLSHRTLARSEDGGRRWVSHRFDALQEPAFLFSLHADPQRGSLVAAGGQGSVMVAPDGRHWRQASSGHGTDYLGLLAHPQEPLVLLYGTGGHVLHVDSQAARWHTVALPSPDPVYGGFHAGDVQVLLGAAGLVLDSQDSGRSWQMQRLGNATLHVGTTSPDGRNWLVAGDRGALFRRRADVQGEPGAWQRVEGPAADWRVLQPDAAGRALWLAGSDGRFARSTDGGLSWTASVLPTRSALRRPVLDPVRQRWWMPGRDGTLLRSDDDGLHWQRVFTHTDEHLKGVWVDPASGAVLAYGARLVRIEPQDSP
jgi:photosystem II stability/assembly factor-like uncharacterized protein